MAHAPSLNVSLTAHLEQFIATLLSSGRYQSASEVVRAGLRLLEAQEAANLNAAPGPSDLRAIDGYEFPMTGPDGNGRPGDKDKRARTRKPEDMAGRRHG
jgi:putative addiction module CopG family antidote